MLKSRTLKTEEVSDKRLKSEELRLDLKVEDLMAEFWNPKELKLNLKVKHQKAGDQKTWRLSIDGMKVEYMKANDIKIEYKKACLKA